jgi:ubiquinone/menaquinone biosynthesis C-methylase UbiE
VTSGSSYLYVAPDLLHAGIVADATLAATTERHEWSIAPPALQPVADPAGDALPAGGAVIELASGLPSPPQLRLIARLLQAGRRAWIYWPAERAVECVDAERLESLRHHVDAVKWLRRLCVPLDRVAEMWERTPTALRWIYRGEFPVRRSDIHVRLTLLTVGAQPVPFAAPYRRTGDLAFAGTGLYLRTDYWRTEPGDDRTARIVSGLAAVTDSFVVVTPRRDPCVGENSVHQIAMDMPRRTDGQDALVLASTHYGPIVKAVCQTLRPAYIYDCGAAGESVGAELSQLLRIPYIFEYRGAGAAVREAIGGASPFYQEIYAQAEELGLRQATVVVVETPALKGELVSRGIDAARVLVVPPGHPVGTPLAAFAAEQQQRVSRTASIDTGDEYKDRVQDQWNQNPVGSQHARESQPHTLDWFLEVERHRYGVYAPWMPDVMEFSQHAGHDLLEIGGGMGTDLAQFARHGARVTDLDLAAGHLKLAEENFRLRGLAGNFIHHDAELLPFPDGSFDLVYSNGVLHHTPNTATVVREIHRVLRPGGRAIVMLYAEHSLYYWRKLVWRSGVKGRLLDRLSMGEIMSRQVERSANEARPLVKVYTKPRAAQLFKDFETVEILQRQLELQDLPGGLKWTLSFTEERLGWNLIIKASKPR